MSRSSPLTPCIQFSITSSVSPDCPVNPADDRRRAGVDRWDQFGCPRVGDLLLCQLRNHAHRLGQVVAHLVPDLGHAGHVSEGRVGHLGDKLSPVRGKFRVVLAEVPQGLIVD